MGSLELTSLDDAAETQEPAQGSRNGRKARQEFPRFIMTYTETYDTFDASPFLLFFNCVHTRST
jgi:hypothetical protein